MKYQNKGGITRHSGCPVCGRPYVGNYREVNKLLAMHMKVAHDRIYQDYDRPKIRKTQGTDEFIGMFKSSHALTAEEFEALCLAIPENAK